MALGRVRSVVDFEDPRTVWLISLTHGVNEFFSILLPPLFPFFVPDLGIGYTDASLLVAAFFAAYSVFQMPVGVLGDVYSSRVLLAGGTLVMAAGVAVVAAVPTFPLMLVGMAVAGIGGSTYHPVGMAVISDVESEGTHGRSMGIHATMGTVGTVTAPVVLTAVAVAHGWRTALLAASALGAVFSAAVFLAYPRSARDGTADLRVLLRAVDVDAERARDRLRNAWRFVREPATLQLLVLFVVSGAEIRSVQTFVPAFAADAAGNDPAFGNAMLVVMMVSAGGAATVAGYVIDLIDRRGFMIASFLLTSLVVAGLVALPLSRLALPVAFVVLGVVMYSLNPAKNALAAAVSEEERSGSLFGLTNTASTVGATSGPVILGVFADAFTIHTGFLATIGFALVGLLLVLSADGLFASVRG